MATPLTSVPEDEVSPLLSRNQAANGFSTISSPSQQQQQQQQQHHPPPPPPPPQNAPPRRRFTSSSTARNIDMASSDQPPHKPNPAPLVTTTPVHGHKPVSSAITHGPTYTPVPGQILKADTELSWGAPMGGHIRGSNDENLVIFRRAVGINTTLAGSGDMRSLEEGRRGAVGIYLATMKAQRHKAWLYTLSSVLIWLSHFSQVVIGATLTALGPMAGDWPKTITILGAANTVIAGVLALVKGQGLPDRMRHDQAEFRKLQDWIEQTEALLAVGVIGRNRKEVGLLVQVAFKKYNSAKECVDNNVPENYVRAAAAEMMQQQQERSRSRDSGSDSDGESQRPSLTDGTRGRGR